MQAKSLGHVIVSLNTDSFAERYKRKPVLPLRERIVVMGTSKFVDTVMINEGDEDSKPSILKSGANIIMHGDDWTGEEYMKQLGVTQEWLDEHGIEIIYTPYTKSVSTTKLLDDAKTANIISRIELNAKDKRSDGDQPPRSVPVPSETIR